MNKKLLEKKLVELSQKAENMSNGYIGLTKNGEIWTYASEPSPNNCLYGLQAGTKFDQTWINTCLGIYPKDI